MVRSSQRDAHCGTVVSVAVVAAVNDTNGGLYMALMGQYGKAEDAGAYSVMALESRPFLTMVSLGVAGLSAFPVAHHSRCGFAVGSWNDSR